MSFFNFIVLEDIDRANVTEDGGRPIGYLTVWKVLEEMTVDFRTKNVAIPTAIMSELKTAKTMIKILRVDPKGADSLQKIEEYLRNVEVYLVSEGEKRFGKAYSEGWLRRIDQANRKKPDEEEEETRFISGVPRQQKWIRLTASTEIPFEKLEALAEESGLSHIVQPDGVILVFGKDLALKKFIKNVAAKYGSKAGRTTRSA